MPSFIQLPVADPALQVTQALTDLDSRPAKIAPKFFYDALGSRLFEAITELPSYDITRVEAAIFREHGPAMAQALRNAGAQPRTMIDLGAGNAEKASRLFGLFDPARYVAVDISTDFLREALQRLQRVHPTLDIVGVGADFSARLDLPSAVRGAPTLVFYPGSSIGNFEPPAALRFLREARALAERGALLIGVDLVKPSAVVEAAYDDELGVTAAFNLNVLLHLNRIAGTDFEIAEWRHVAFFDAEASRIEMHLEARHDTVVQWAGGERRFDAGERILTEYSYKWTAGSFEHLLRDAGFGSIKHWTDADARFAVFLAFA